MLSRRPLFALAAGLFAPAVVTAPNIMPVKLWVPPKPRGLLRMHRPDGSVAWQGWAEMRTTGMGRLGLPRLASVHEIGFGGLPAGAYTATIEVRDVPGWGGGGPLPVSVGGYGGDYRVVHGGGLRHRFDTAIMLG